jgi:hypothetical protein
MYDLFFVTYEEPNANLNWAKIKDRFPHAKRVHGIKGINEAHKHCATNSFTSMFWTVDGDTIVDDSWDFSYLPPEWDRTYLHLWYSRNPVNGLSYGYGSVKLWPKQQVLKHVGPWLDFTTSVGNIKIVEQTIATTMFNTSPFESWKSAFRECVKLDKNLKNNPADAESLARLTAWQYTVSGADFSKWCNFGAFDALLWGTQPTSHLAMINDFGWLKHKFSSLYPWSRI